MNFSEKDLKRAAKAVDESMLDNLPPPEAPSPQLLEKLDKLTAKPARKSKWKTVLSRVAASILVVFLVGGCWLTVDAEARNLLLFWFRDFTEEHYIYQFVETEHHEALPQYAFGWLPEGWELSHQDDDSPNFDRYGFWLEKGTAHFSLMYFYPKAGIRYVLVQPYAGIRVSHSTLTIRGSQADYYEITGIRPDRRLIWMDDSSGILFQLSGDLPEEADLIRMVESLHPVEEE